MVALKTHRFFTGTIKPFDSLIFPVPNEKRFKAIIDNLCKSRKFRANGANWRSSGYQVSLYFSLFPWTEKSRKLNFIIGSEGTTTWSTRPRSKGSSRSDWTNLHVYIGIDATDDPAPRASLACSWSCC